MKVLETGNSLSRTCVPSYCSFFQYVSFYRVIRRNRIRASHNLFYLLHLSLISKNEYDLYNLFILWDICIGVGEKKLVIYNPLKTGYFERLKGDDLFT